MPNIISIPQMNVETGRYSDAQHLDRKSRFGYFETQHTRPTQEDALARYDLSKQELTRAGTSVPLTPQEIGYRLWTSYQLLDKKVIEKRVEDGTTASTTVYDGNGNLINATLGDAASFAVIYGKDGKPLAVVRINEVTHKPTDSWEAQRIIAAGGFVQDGRVQGRLAISRAIGDASFKGSGVTSEAHITITSLDKIADQKNIKREDIGSIQIITTCDGFTDGAGQYATKADHEKYLLDALRDYRFKQMSGNRAPGNMPEDELAKLLAERAIRDGSRDNISVAIQTITPEILLNQKTSTLPTPPFLMGVYDGHGGPKAAIHVALNIDHVFKAQCALTPEVYAQQELSVYKKVDFYRRDNGLPEPIVEQGQKQGQSQGQEQELAARQAKEDAERQAKELAELRVKKLADRQAREHAAGQHREPAQLKQIVAQLLKLTLKYRNNLDKKHGKYPKEIIPIIDELVRCLQNKQKTDSARIEEFYTFLNSAASSNQKNIELIKQDTRKFAKDFLKGIAIIVATLCTGILPGLVISGIVYLATGRHPLDFFKTHGEQFEKEVQLVKENNKTYAAFFQAGSQPKDQQQEQDPEQDIKPVR